MTNNILIDLVANEWYLFILFFISIIILIYLGAAVSTERKNNRENFETIGNSTEDIWWENGFLFMCPLH